MFLQTSIAGSIHSKFDQSPIPTVNWLIQIALGSKGQTVNSSERSLRISSHCLRSEQIYLKRYAHTSELRSFELVKPNFHPP